MLNSKGISCFDRTFHWSFGLIGGSTLADVIIPVDKKPFSEGDGHVNVIFIGGGYNTWGRYAGKVEHPTFASDYWCVPGVGSVWVDVEGATGFLLVFGGA